MGFIRGNCLHFLLGYQLNDYKEMQETKLPERHLFEYVALALIYLMGLLWGFLPAGLIRAMRPNKNRTIVGNKTQTISLNNLKLG